MPQVLIAVCFIALVLACCLLILRAISTSWRGERTRGRAFAVASLLLIGWLGLTSGLALSGALTPSPDHPPPNGALLAVVLVTVCLIAFGPVGGRITRHVSAPKLIAFQVFRLPVELIL